MVSCSLPVCRASVGWYCGCGCRPGRCAGLVRSLPSGRSHCAYSLCSRAAHPLCPCCSPWLARCASARLALACVVGRTSRAGFHLSLYISQTNRGLTWLTRRPILHPSHRRDALTERLATMSDSITSFRKHVNAAHASLHRWSTGRNGNATEENIQFHTRRAGEILDGSRCHDDPLVSICPDVGDDIQTRSVTTTPFDLASAFAGQRRAHHRSLLAQILQTVLARSARMHD